MITAWICAHVREEKNRTQTQAVVCPSIPSIFFSAGRGSPGCSPPVLLSVGSLPGDSLDETFYKQNTWSVIELGLSPHIL